MSNLENYQLNDETINLYKKCFDINGSPKKIENIKWKFSLLENNNSFVSILYDHDKKKTAAIYAVSCVKVRVGEDTLVGSQSLDTMADVDYRGMGYPIRLAKEFNEKAKNNGIALVYGFPNKDSVRGFLSRHLKWQPLDPVPFLIKPLKTKYFTKRFARLKFLPNINLSLPGSRFAEGFVFKEQKRFPEEVSDLWHQFSKNIKVAVERDKNYLEWRYVAKPNENYKVLHCYSDKDEYLGFIVYTVKEKHSGKIGYIMELIYDLNKPKVGKLLLKRAIENIKKMNADCILSWSLEHSPNYRIFTKEFFLKMPDKLRPIELHFAARSFSKDLDDLIYKRESWYISYSDSDTV